MNILEEFWYVNLDPAEYDASPSEEYRELIRLISRNEEKLLGHHDRCPERFVLLLSRLCTGISDYGRTLAVSE